MGAGWGDHLGYVSPGKNKTVLKSLRWTRPLKYTSAKCESFSKNKYYDAYCFHFERRHQFLSVRLKKTANFRVTLIFYNILFKYLFSREIIEIKNKLKTYHRNWLTFLLLKCFIEDTEKVKVSWSNKIEKK